MTAVEFIEQHLLLDDNWRRIFEQAKEMEKQQIIDAWEKGFFADRKGENIDA
jgi:hypothetical protein